MTNNIGRGAVIERSQTVYSHANPDVVEESALQLSPEAIDMILQKFGQEWLDTVIELARKPGGGLSDDELEIHVIRAGRVRHSVANGMVPSEQCRKFDDEGLNRQYDEAKRLIRRMRQSLA